VDGLSVQGLEENPFLNFLYNDQLTSDYVDKFYEALCDLDGKILEQRDATVLSAWMQAYLEKNLENINMARVILLGNGGAGKTSLVRKIVDAKASTAKQEETPRIEISHYKHKGVDVDFWDFGGQVMMHATHTFFLNEEASYIIVCNARADEQPDKWLEVLKHTLIKENTHSKKIHVFVVYTHVDSKNEKKNFSKYRKNSLNRKYGEHFHLQYAIHSSEKVDDSAFDKLKEVLFEQIVIQGKQTSFQSVVVAYKQSNNPTISYKELVKENTLFKDDDMLYVKQFIAYGLLFPLRASDVYEDADVFVWQKHWLTYGVYELINSEETRSKNGFLNKSDFEKILFKGEEQYIHKDGSLDSSSKDAIESIQYDEKGREILYDIVRNYNWAIDNQSRRGEIIFPHAVQLDEPEYALLKPYVTNPFLILWHWQINMCLTLSFYGVMG